MNKSDTPEYRAWSDMKQRCTNPKNKYFSSYGGRGIKVCKEWGSFDSFLLSMGARPSDNHSLDRIDVDGGYAPPNCRWATATVQNRNMRIHKSDSVGISPSATSGRWVAEIAVNDKTLKIGTYSSYGDAIRARKQAEQDYWINGKTPRKTGDLSANNKSGKTGVCQDKRWGTWTAFYGGPGRRVHIGSFATFEDAAIARNSYIAHHKVGVKP